MKNRNFLILLSSMVLLVVAFGGLVYFNMAKNIFAQVTCPSHSHQSGDQCFCDDYYKPEGGQCVAMTDLEICGEEHAHREGDQCWCDEGYGRLEGVGDCVPESSGCPANSHWTGTECLCDEGYGNIDGKCTSKSSYCASYHAHYVAAIDGCECDEGYVENEAGDDCVVVPANVNLNTNQGTTTNKNTNKNANLSTTNLNKETNANTNVAVLPPANANAEPEETLVTTDLTDIMVTLIDNPKIDFSVQPGIDITLIDAPKTEKQRVKEQIESTISLLSLNKESVELKPTEEQEWNLIKEIVTEKVDKELIVREREIDAAEAAGNVKDRKDKERFEDLKKQKTSLLKQIKDNEDALEVMQKQYIQLVNADQVWAANMYNMDKKFNTDSKRNFLGETNGDPHEAAVNCQIAIAAQMKLIAKLKDDLRAVEEEMISLLDVSPEPDVDQEMEKIKVEWYK